MNFWRLGKRFRINARETVDIGYLLARAAFYMIGGKTRMMILPNIFFSIPIYSLRSEM